MLWSAISLVDGADAVQVRSIPTRVGSTFAKSSSAYIHAVHPHACGEYNPLHGSRAVSSGPSPRVWGVRTPPKELTICGRSIPTRVGSTYTAPKILLSRPDHPHACGEYDSRLRPGSAIPGPSPRVWGVRATRGQTPLMTRSIPTRVGSTLQEDARNNSLLAELQRATEPCVLQACSDDDKKGKELCKAAPSPRKTLPGRAVTLS